MYKSSVSDGSLDRFKRVVAAALHELENRRQEVNDLNVFPVADGDTGDNMALTMRAVVEELDKLDDSAMDDVGRGEIVSAVARAALLGARGNSGVILSQVVRGAHRERHVVARVAIGDREDVQVVDFLTSLLEVRQSHGHDVSKSDYR